MEFVIQNLSSPMIPTEKALSCAFMYAGKEILDITKLPIKRKYKWMMLLFSEHCTLLLFAKVMSKAMKTELPIQQQISICSDLLCITRASQQALKILLLCTVMKFDRTMTVLLLSACCTQNYHIVQKSLEKAPSLIN